MNTYHYTEDSYEQTILDLFKEWATTTVMDQS